MRSIKSFLMLLLLIFFALISTPLLAGQVQEVGSTGGSGGTKVSINVFGRIVDTENKAIDEVKIDVSVNGKVVDHVLTDEDGKYLSHFQIAAAEIPTAMIRIKAAKASFKVESREFKGAELPNRAGTFYLKSNMLLPRVLGPAFWISTIIFILVYAIISFELLHRTVAAMLGAGLMMFVSYTFGTIYPSFRIFTFKEAITSIDMNVIFLLLGMMVIVGVLKYTGVFQWCAYMAYRLARGKVFLLTIYLIVFTGVTSAFIDNVTTMLLLTGVAIEICISLSLNPLVILIPLVLASNIGGTATLIGDPPNIMIGSYAHLTFMNFVTSLGIICGLAAIVLVIMSKLIWGKDYASGKTENVAENIEKLRDEYKITDSTLLIYGLAILGFVVFLFISHGYWHMEVSVAAIMGASVLMTISVLTKKVDLNGLIEKDIEWPTLLFFIFLFIIVGAIDTSGLLDLIASWILDFSHGNFVAACTLIIWVSAILSAFVDNIPFTATMLPVVGYLSTVIPGAGNTLWWALAIGACFGGNGTIIGASANVVTMGIAEARGYKISFGRFMKYAFPFMIVSVAIGYVWLLVFRPQ